MIKVDNETLINNILKDSNKLPITSSKICLTDKGVNYKILMLMTLLSNVQLYKDILDTGNEETWRYLYRNKLKECKDLVESLSQTKLNTVLRTIKKMEKLDCNVIAIRKTENNEIVYDINYGTREYVTIETKIMKALINSFNSNSIKIYVILKYMCRNGKRRITQEWLLNQIGLTSYSKNNRQMISDITTELHCGGYINKETISIEGNKIINYYEVNSFDEWISIRKLGNRK